MINPDVEIERVFRVPDELEPGTIVADVEKKADGKVFFDHHQPDAPLREDGHKHAACGQFLEAFAEEIFPGGVPQEFEDAVAQIEDADNGIPTTDLHFISTFASSMNPEWNAQGEQANADALFKATVEVVRVCFLQPYLEHEHLPEVNLMFFDKINEELENRHEEACKAAEDIVRSALAKSDGHVVLLEQFCPWADVLIDSSAEFAVYPSNRGGFNLQCVPPEKQSFDKKIELPAAWLDEKPDGCSFVHPAKFLASFETAEQAMAAAEQVVQAHEQPLDQNIDEHDQGVNIDTGDEH